MPLPDLILLSLAVWRISLFLVRESGPFNLFRKIREITGISHDDDGEVVMIPDRFFAQILSCIWCCSVWIAAGAFAGWLFNPSLVVAVSAPFALSACVILLDKWGG